MSTDSPSATPAVPAPRPADPQDRDLLGHDLTPAETDLLSAYDALRALLASDDLPPCAAAGVRAALAPLAVVVTDLGLRFEHLTDLGV